MDMTVDACDPPRRLAVSAGDDHDRWRLDMVLVEKADVTQHLTGTEGVGEIGPGWE